MSTSSHIRVRFYSCASSQKLPMAQACPGCEKLFPLQQSQGNCAKCMKLDSLSQDSQQYKDISVGTQSYHYSLYLTFQQRQLQCLVCGVTRRHGMPECDSPELQTCGSRDCSKYFSGGQMQPQTRRGPSWYSFQVKWNHITDALPDTANIPQSYVDLAQKTRDRLRASVPPAAEPSRINTNTLVHHESIIHSQEYEYVVFWQVSKPNSDILS